MCARDEGDTGRPARARPCPPPARLPPFKRSSFLNGKKIGEDFFLRLLSPEIRQSAWRALETDEDVVDGGAADVFCFVMFARDCVATAFALLWFGGAVQAPPPLLLHASLIWLVAAQRWADRDLLSRNKCMCHMHKQTREREWEKESERLSEEGGGRERQKERERERMRVLECLSASFTTIRTWMMCFNSSSSTSSWTRFYYTADCLCFKAIE